MDKGLAEQVARRDGTSPAALEKLFLRHAEPLRRFLGRKLRSDAEAEDLVHDAFVKVAEKAGSFRGDSPFRTWLFTLALNLLRTRARRASLEAKADETIAVRRPEVLDRPAEADPSLSAEQRDLWVKVEGAIGELPENEREIFLLYWFGQLTYAEISEITGVGISAAKVRVHRALGRLTEKMRRET